MTVVHDAGRAYAAEGTGTSSLDLESLDQRERYKVVTGLLVPRPIALVSTVDIEGHQNVAPFSFFNAVSHDPPLFVISCSGAHRVKDTQRNAEATQELVVAIPSVAMSAAVDVCGGELPAEVDEFKLAGLTPRKASKIAPSLIEEAPVNFECLLRQVVPLLPSAYVLLVVEAIAVHWHDGVRDGHGYVDAGAIDPLARLGGRWYAGLGSIFPGEGAAHVRDAAT